jgi:hypothetical protein
MAEDSGAFKTNPANSRTILAFSAGRGRRCNEASPVQETFSGPQHGVPSADFYQTAASRCGILKSA